MKNQIKYNHNINMATINTIWKNDTDPTKPKKLFLKSGQPTKKAIAYSRKLIREGKTNRYIKEGFVYNPNTMKEINPYTKTGKLKASFKKSYELYQGTAVRKKETIDRSYTIPADLKEDWDSNSLSNNYLLEYLTMNLEGQYRIIILINGQKIKDDNVDLYDGWFTAGYYNYLVGGTPPRMVWNGTQNALLTNTNLPVGTKVTFIITKERQLPKQFYEQNYKHGLTNCLLTPIANYLWEKAKTIKTKKIRETYLCKSLKMKDLIKETHNGVSHAMIQKICDQYQIAIKLIKPFSNEIYFKATSMKKPIKEFTFLNSLIDHVDEFDGLPIVSPKAKYAKQFNPEYVDQKFLNEKLKELIKNNDFYVYQKGAYGIRSIKTLTDYYTLRDEFADTCTAFEKATGLINCDFDALRYPDLADHVNKGTHFNGTVDFKNTDHLRQVGKQDEAPKNINHIDMKKAYSNFYQTKYYNGFMGNIQIWRKTKNMDNIGLYAIKNINFNKANEKFRRLNDIMNIYQDSVYSSPELQFLIDNGVTFTITHGCYSLEELDFRFTDDMINNKDVVKVDEMKVLDVSYYAKYCGKLASQKKHNNFYIRGNRQLLSTITQTNDLQIYPNDYDNEHRICYRKEHLYTKKHITAQIIAYQRIQMLEQLLEMNVDKIIRVCVDGIYFEPHDFKLKGVFRKKDDEMTFRNHPHTSYINDIIESGYKPNHNYENLGIERIDYQHELHSGAGGTGKTYYNLIKDRGLIHPIYTTLSWKLCSDMAKDYKKNTGHYLHHTVFNQLAEDKGDGLQQRYGTYIIDECSMLTEAQKRHFMNTLPKTIFLGDIEAQLPPVRSREMITELCKKYGTKDPRKIPKNEIIQMNSSGFYYVKEYTKVWRFNKGDELNDLAKYLRDVINSKKYHRIKYSNILEKFNVKQISRHQVNKLYNYKEDMILGANKHQHAFYLDTFKNYEKYKVKSNFSHYKNGEIVYEKIKGVAMEQRHCYTVHSVQGLTFEGKLFIDKEDLSDLKMFYTAISRARSIEQIYLVEKDDLDTYCEKNKNIIDKYI